MDKELMEQIAKVLYKYNAITKPNWEEATDEWKSYARGQTKAILPIIDAQVREAESRGYDKACDDIKEGGE